MKLLESLLKPFYNYYKKHYIKEETNVMLPMIKNINNFNQDVSDIMTARIDIVALEINTSYIEVMELISQSGLSRIPVYEQELDNIKGVLHVKDLFRYINQQDFQWNRILREPFFIPETKNINSLLKEFQQEKRHLAIVVDEYGVVTGLVSLEDVIEEIVGEISDEFDKNEEQLFTKLGKKTFLLKGKITINDFSKAIGLDNDDKFDLVKKDADTLAGMLIEIAGYLPKQGETVKFENYFFIIEQADERKIDTIKLIIK